jgi:hypothetical protein
MLARDLLERATLRVDPNTRATTAAAIIIAEDNM